MFNPIHNYRKVSFYSIALLIGYGVHVSGPFIQEYFHRRLFRSIFFREIRALYFYDVELTLYPLLLAFIPGMVTIIAIIKTKGSITKIFMGGFFGFLSWSIIDLIDYMTKEGAEVQFLVFNLLSNLVGSFIASAIIFVFVYYLIKAFKLEYDQQLKFPFSVKWRSLLYVNLSAIIALIVFSLLFYSPPQYFKMIVSGWDKFGFIPNRTITCNNPQELVSSSLAIDSVKKTTNIKIDRLRLFAPKHKIGILHNYNNKFTTSYYEVGDGNISIEGAWFAIMPYPYDGEWNNLKPYIYPTSKTNYLYYKEKPLSINPFLFPYVAWGNPKSYLELSNFKFALINKEIIAFLILSSSPIQIKLPKDTISNSGETKKALSQFMDKDIFFKLKHQKKYNDIFLRIDPDVMKDVLRYSAIIFINKAESFSAFKVDSTIKRGIVGLNSNKIICDSTIYGNKLYIEPTKAVLTLPNKTYTLTNGNSVFFNDKNIELQFKDDGTVNVSGLTSELWLNGKYWSSAYWNTMPSELRIAILSGLFSAIATLIVTWVSRKY